MFIRPLPEAAGGGGGGVTRPDFGHGWAWTWQLLPSGDTPAHFSTFVPSKKVLKVDCRGSTKDETVLGHQGSWLLLPAVGLLSAHVTGGLCRSISDLRKHDQLEHGRGTHLLRRAALTQRPAERTSLAQSFHQNLQGAQRGGDAHHSAG